MADITYSFKTDEETRERIKQLIEESGISGKDFFGNLLSAYELEKVKEGSPLLTADIDELESLTKRINAIFINIGERVNTLQATHAEQLRQSQESGNSTIELLQQRIKSLEIERLQDEERIQSFIEDKEQVESQASGLHSRINELEETIQDKNSLIGEYKEKLDTLTSIVNEYKAASGENQKLKSENAGLTAQIQDYQKQLDLLSSRLDDKAAEYAEQLTKQQDALAITHEKNILELERKHQRELQEQQERHSRKLDEYENKVKTLLEQIQDNKTALKASKTNRVALQAQEKKNAVIASAEQATEGNV